MQINIPSTDRRVRSTEKLVENGTALIVSLEELEQSRTHVLKDLAEIVVKLRAQHEHRGMPDWAGRSTEYRDVVAKMYRDAGVPEDSVSNIQASLRYHIGNELREQAPAEELAQLGLSEEGPKGREKARRADTKGKAQRVAEQVIDLTTGGDVVARVNHARRDLEAIDEAAMAKADIGQMRAELAETLSLITRLLTMTNDLAVMGAEAKTNGRGRGAKAA